MKLLEIIISNGYNCIHCFRGGVEVLTTLTPSLIVHFGHARAMASLSAVCSRPHGA